VASRNILKDCEVMELTGGEDVEPWDRQEILASVDEICNSYYLRTHNNCAFKDPSSSSTPSLRRSSPRSDFPLGDSSKSGHILYEGYKHQIDSVRAQSTPVPLDKRVYGDNSHQPQFLDEAGATTRYKRGHPKKTHRVWKPKRKQSRLVMEMDVGLSEAV
jgi:hypothetical protein